MLRIGLTGGIGAGKSTVSRRLAERGAVVVDADLVAREVVVPGSEGLAAVVEEFGPDVLQPDGTLDRAGLGRRVFGDAAALARLNAVMHPRIAARTLELMATAPADAVVVHDMPLIVENGLATNYHLVVVVDAPEQVRAERLVRDRGSSPEDAWRRIRSQATDEQRRAAADVLLDNSAEVGPLLAGTDALWTGRLVPFERNLRERRRAERPAAVELADPDPTWPDQARRLLGRIAAVTGGAGRGCRAGLRAGLRAAGLEAGRAASGWTTSARRRCPGLAAKDLLDLQLVLPDLAAADRLRDPLQDAGFVRARRGLVDARSSRRRHRGQADARRLRPGPRGEPARAGGGQPGGARAAGVPGLAARAPGRAGRVRRGQAGRSRAPAGAGAGSVAGAGIGIEEYMERRYRWFQRRSAGRWPGTRGGTDDRVRAGRRGVRAGELRRLLAGRCSRGGRRRGDGAGRRAARAASGQPPLPGP